MALDLKLLAISDKAQFIMEKAFKNVFYAGDLDKITDTESLTLQLKAVQNNPDGTPEIILEELINDSKKVIELYPDKVAKKYYFYSVYRTYETINYLLKHHISHIENSEFLKKDKVFFEGIDIHRGLDFVRFQYMDSVTVTKVCALLESIDYQTLIKYYDYEIMKDIVYKVTHPENLFYLKTEYELLKQFYKNAKSLNAFLLIEIY